MHKTILTVALAAIIQLSYSQISIDGGVTTRSPYASFKVAYEKTFYKWLNVESAVRTDFRTAIPSVSVGLETPLEDDCSIKLMGGYYYHVIPATKNNPSSTKQRFGCSFRWEVNQGSWGIEWNGQFASLTVGFIFRRRD